MPLPTNLERALIQHKDKTMPVLDISEKGIIDSDIVKLVELIEKNNVSISYLNLYRNMISNFGAIELSSLATVKEVNLDANEIKDDGALALFASNIKIISLNDNNLTDVCLSALLNCKQQSLEVDNNKFSAESMEKIQSKFSKKPNSSLSIQTSPASSQEIEGQQEEKSQQEAAILKELKDLLQKARHLPNYQEILQEAVQADGFEVVKTQNRSENNTPKSPIVY